MHNTFAAALETITESFRIAYQVHGGEPIAIEHARTRAGGALADVFAEKLQHETTMRMVIKPDIDDATIETIATETGIGTNLVRDVLGAVLAHQLTGVNHIRKAAPDER